MSRLGKRLGGLLGAVGRLLRRGAALPVSAVGSVRDWSRRRPRAATATFAVTALILASLSGLFVVLHLRADAEDRAGGTALAAAEEAVPTLLSYDHRTLVREVETRTAMLGGTFRDDYLTLLNDIVIPASEREQLTTHTSVAGAGISEVDGSDTVRLLMFLNQTSSRAGQEEPTLSGSRVRVTMERQDDRWLVTELVPV